MKCNFVCLSIKRSNYRWNHTASWRNNTISFFPQSQGQSFCNKKFFFQFYIKIGLLFNNSSFHWIFGYIDFRELFQICKLCLNSEWDFLNFDMTRKDLLRIPETKQNANWKFFFYFLFFLTESFLLYWCKLKPMLESCLQCFFKVPNINQKPKTKYKRCARFENPGGRIWENYW